MMYKNDDVSLKSLSPNRDYCQLTDNDLVRNKSDIAILMQVANKSVAHLTFTFSNDTDHLRLPFAKKAIYELVLKYVPEINRNNLWYDKEVLTRAIN